MSTHVYLKFTACGCHADHQQVLEQVQKDIAELILKYTDYSLVVNCKSVRDSDGTHTVNLNDKAGITRHYTRGGYVNENGAS